MKTAEEIMNAVPEHREKSRAKIFQDHCYAYHNNYILLEYNQETCELTICAGSEKRTNKPLKESNLLNLGELLVLPVKIQEWDASEEKDESTQFVVRLV